MRRWSEIAEQVAATSRTSEKVARIAAYLRTLDPVELPIATVFFSGRPFPEADGRALGVGWAAIAAATLAVAGIDPDALARAYDRHSDLGRAVGDVLADAGHRPDPGRSPRLGEVAAAFAEIEATPGAAAKTERLRELLARCDPLTASYVVKILTGELRIGLRDGLLEAAIAAAFERPLDAVKWAAMLTGDLGRTALLARDDRLHAAELVLFHPIRFMLASPAEDAGEILRRLGPDVWLEDKYDGIRAQLHRAGERVVLFSRDLRPITEQFPEVAAAAAGLDWSGILDGEILAERDGRVLPFLALQSRLGRKAPPAALVERVPVTFVAFDLLALGPRDGGAEPLLRLPLAERRRRLDEIDLPTPEAGGRFRRSLRTVARSVEAIEAAFRSARERGNEGLLAKDPRSQYTPGRRGFGWLKMKRALATLDCVVVGVELGHGKRHGVLSDYTFAVRDEASGDLVTIGKAYSGLTDAEIAELTRWFEAHTIRRHGRYRVVEPQVVVEVAFDVIMRSARHRSGFALRFPRIVRLRTDKTPADIDTLATVERLFRELQPTAEHLVTEGARGELAEARPERTGAARPEPSGAERAERRR